MKTRQTAALLLALLLLAGLAGCGGKGQEAASAPGTVDLDLTVMSGTMVFAQVYNMMQTPEDFVGKVVKIEGLFTIYRDEAADRTFYSCIILDATACCSQGIDLLLSSEEDLPEMGEEIVAVGTFDTYLHDGYLMKTLRGAVLLPPEA